MQHNKCPWCKEDVFLEELVEGKCPLCGFSLQDMDESFWLSEISVDDERLAWILISSHFYKRLIDLGASPLPVMELIREDLQIEPDERMKRDFSLDVSFRWWERLTPKRCSSCGKFFLRNGRKRLRGSLDKPHFTFEYICSICSE